MEALAPDRTARFMVALLLTVTLAVPLTAPLVARTFADPVPLLGAVYKPVVLTMPTPPLSIDQVKLGCVARALPNWSLAVALNCCVPPFLSAALPGVRAMLVNV